MNGDPVALASSAKAGAMLKRVSVLGIETSYWVYGDSNSQTNTLLMVHGYRGNHHGLEAIAGALPDLRVIIPDLPGYGGSSEFEEDHSITAYANWLKAFVAEVCPNATVLGHSFGSIVVAAAAASGLTNKLILVNPVARFPGEKHRAMLQAIIDWGYRLCGTLPERLARACLSSPLFVQLMSSGLTKTRDRRIRNWVHAQHLANFSDFKSVRSAIEGYEASISSSVTDFAPEIPNPTLLIIGELDDITPVATEMRNAKLMSHAKLFQLSGVGHLIHYEKPVEAAVEIRKFMA